MASFAQQHLRFLMVDERWMPALIFDEYILAVSILDQGKFEGMGMIDDVLAGVFLERRLSKQSVTGRVAIVLGDVKKVVWEEQISELKGFAKSLPALFGHADYNDPEWQKTVTEAVKFLSVPPILPNLEDLQLAPFIDERLRPGTEFVPSPQESSDEPIAELSLPDSPTVNESVGDCWDKDNGEVLAMPGESVTGGSTQPQNAVDFCANKAARATISRNDSLVIPERGSFSTQDTSAASRLKNSLGRRYKTGGSSKSVRLGKSVKHSLVPSRNGNRVPRRHKNTSPVVSESTKPSLTSSLRTKRTSPRQKVKFHEIIQQCEVRKNVPGAHDDPSVVSEQELAEEYRVPTTREVLPILQLLGYKTAHSKFFRPGYSPKDRKNLEEGLHYFSSPSELRHFLCRRGVENHENVAFPEDMKERLQLWVRYSISPALRKETYIPIEARKPLGSVHIPLMKLGFIEQGHIYYLPGSKPEKRYGLSLNGFELEGPDGMLANLCRYGLPETSNFQNMTDSERLILELFIADCPDVETYEFVEDTEFCQKYVRALAEVSNKQASFIETPKAGNRSTDAAIATETRAEDHGSAAADSTCHTMVTDCSDVSVDKEVHKCDEAEDPPNRRVNASVSPTMADDNSIAEMCRVPMDVSTPEKSPNKVLFGETSTETKKRKVVEAKHDDPTPHYHESARESPSRSLSDFALSQSASAVATAGTRSTEVQTDTGEDAPHELAPLRCMDGRNQAVIPNQDTMNKDVSPPSVNDIPSPEKKRKVVEAEHDDQAQQYHESARELPSRGRSDFALSLSASAIATAGTRNTEVQADTGEDAPYEVSPLRCMDGRNQAVSPDQDTMNKEMEGFSPPPVNDIGSPDADDLVMKYDTSTYSNEENFGDMLLTQDFSMRTDGVNDDSQDAATSAANKFDVDGDVDHAAVGSHTSKGSDEDPAEGLKCKNVRKPVSPRRTDDNSIGNYDNWIKRLARLVKPDAPWKEVYRLMVGNGLYWKYGNGLHSHVYIFPGMLEPDQGGKVKYDFVYDEFDLKEVAVDSLKWNGDKLYFSEKVERERGGRLRSKRVLNASPPDAPKAKKSVHTNLNDKKTQNPGFASPNTARRALEVKSTLGEMLESCQHLLQDSSANHNSANISTGHSSKFQAQVNAIEKFFKVMISSKGSHGESKRTKPILYICGSPGVGKTTAVDWCCDQAEKAVRQGEFVGVSDILIGRVKTVMTRDPTAILNEIADALDMGRKKMTMKNHKAMIETLTKKKDLVILVVDEVDNMISARGGAQESGSAKILQSLCELASDSDCKFSLVGISNAVDIAAAKALKQIGMSGKRIPFATYGEDELVSLVVSRIGSSIIDPKALRFLASMVASKSGDARTMLDLVASAVQIRHDSFSAAQLEGEASDCQPIVSFHDALKAARATVIPLARRIDALPEMTQLVLFVAVTICSNSSANYTMQQLKSYCSQVVEHEHLDRIDYDSFKQFVERLVDQGLLMPNSDIDIDFGSRGLSLPHDMPVRFGNQLQDIQAAVADKLEAKPIYKKLVDRLAASQAIGTS